MIGVVSHDAGGAEILSSYVVQQGLEPLYCLAGPARSIFERKLGKIHVLPLQVAISQSEWILCGTSWQSDLEWRAIHVARAQCRRSIAFLDHWVCYRERFIRGGVEHLPDELWVADKIAEAIAREFFPSVAVSNVGNPYFQEIRRKLAAIPRYPKRRGDGLRVLYACEPIAQQALFQKGDERHWGYTEHDALRFFLTNMSALGAVIDKVVIRPHPSEPSDKYIWAKTEFGDAIVSGGRRSLLEEIMEADVVVGCESTAMVVALLAGRRVISCIPPGGKKCELPQPEVEHLQNLIARSK